MNSIPLEILSYTDSQFTNVHTLVSNSDAIDGRGTFTHMGVKMDGLESARHLNFRCDDGSFIRSHVFNHVMLRSI